MEAVFERNRPKSERFGNTRDNFKMEESAVSRGKPLFKTQILQERLDASCIIFNFIITYVLSSQLKVCGGDLRLAVDVPWLI